MSEAELLALRARLLFLRDEILERLQTELGAGELGLMSGVMTAILAIDETLPAPRQSGGDPGRQ